MLSCIYGLPRTSLSAARSTPALARRSEDGAATKERWAGGTCEDRKRQGCRLRAYRDVFTACPSRSRASAATTRLITGSTGTRQFSNSYRTSTTQYRTSPPGVWTLSSSSSVRFKSARATGESMLIQFLAGSNSSTPTMR